jgi:hypothetical protein
MAWNGKITIAAFPPGYWTYIRGIMETHRLTLRGALMLAMKALKRTDASTINALALELTHQCPDTQAGDPGGSGGVGP